MKEKGKEKRFLVIDVKRFKIWHYLTIFTSITELRKDSRNIL